MSKSQRVSWTVREITDVATMYNALRTKAPGSTLATLLYEAQQNTLPEDRRHPKGWFRSKKNQAVIVQAASHILELRAVEPSKIVSDEPSPPALPSLLEQLLGVAEQLGAAFGKGLVVELSRINEVKPAVTEQVVQFIKPAPQKVLVVGGQAKTIARFREEFKQLDIKHPGDSLQRLKQYVNRWNSPIVVWTNFVGHDMVEVLRTANAKNVLRVHGNMEVMRNALNQLASH